MNSMVPSPSHCFLYQKQVMNVKSLLVSCTVVSLIHYFICFLSTWLFSPCVHVGCQPPTPVSMFFCFLSTLAKPNWRRGYSKPSPMLRASACSKPPVLHHHPRLPAIATKQEMIITLNSSEVECIIDYTRCQAYCILSPTSVA